MIINDTGWKGVSTGIRCYYASERTVEFDRADEAEMKALIEAEKKDWYGQEFSARITGNRIVFRRAVDSG